MKMSGLYACSFADMLFVQRAGVPRVKNCCNNYCSIEFAFGTITYTIWYYYLYHVQIKHGNQDGHTHLTNIEQYSSYPPFQHCKVD